MAISVIRGLVVQEARFGEADKMLTILAKDIGKVNVSARGARRLKTPVSAGSALFTYGDFTIKTGTKHHFLNQADVIESFYNISKDIYSLAYGSAILELAAKTTAEDIPANNVLMLTVYTLKMLAEGVVSPPLAFIIYQLKVLQYNGFMPQTDCCISCGKAHNNIITTDGVLCSSCAAFEHRLIEANPTAVYTMQYIFANEGQRLFCFNLDEKYLPLLTKIADMLVEAHLSVRLNSKKFIESLNIS